MEKMKQVTSKPNVKRGLFRIWIVCSVIWICAAGYVLRDNLTAKDLGLGLGQWISPYAPAEEQLRIRAQWAKEWEDAPIDYKTRTIAAAYIIGPPLFVLLFGLLGTRIFRWIKQGFLPN